MKPIPYGRQHITQQDIDAVTDALQRDFLTTGPLVAEFENQFAKYIGSKYAVAVSNGTAALHLGAMALDVNKNTNVITAPITFSASANCIRYCDGNVFFADIEENTHVLDPEKVRSLIESKPKGFFSGIIPVDLAGYPLNMQAFRSIADEYDLWILEDACHAPGGWYTDLNNEKQSCGNCAHTDLAIFSFHPVKHITTGEGGMITTNDEKLFKRLKALRTHGIIRDPELMIENHGRWYYEIHTLGYNYRLPDILCALGISQLSRAKENLQRRQEIAKKYDSAFDSAGIRFTNKPNSIRHAHHLYVILINNRKELYDKLISLNIFPQIHYVQVHKLPYYKKLYGEINLPNSQKYYDQCLSLPIYPTLTDDEQDYVIENVIKYAR